MVRGTDWHSSSIYRAGWKGSEGYVKASEVSYSGLFHAPNPGVFRKKIKKRAKFLISTLLDEEEMPEEEKDELLNNCIKRGLEVFGKKG